MKVAIVQKVVPLYREEFFSQLSEKVDLTVFLYEEAKGGDVTHSDSIRMRHIRNIAFRNIRYVSLFTLLFGGFDTLVLELHQGHISTWLLLLTRFIHRKKIILWGQGISVKRYCKEEKKANMSLKLMIKMSNGCWIYMPKEKDQWQKIYPKKAFVALGNTISGIKGMLNYESNKSQEELKNKYDIKEDIVFIYCARFNTLNRRTDLLEEVITQLGTNKYGFIIIGDGQYKPDFSKYPNVYDFGRVYDNEIKEELFSISDAYFQPAWLGLSIVEAMARGNSVLTFKRTESLMHGVELDYIKNGYNGLLFEDLYDAVAKISSISKADLSRMGDNAKKYIKENATMDKMVNNAVSLLMKL